MLIPEQLNIFLETEASQITAPQTSQLQQTSTSPTIVCDDLNEGHLQRFPWLCIYSHQKKKKIQLYQIFINFKMRILKENKSQFKQHMIKTTILTLYSQNEFLL